MKLHNINFSISLELIFLIVVIYFIMFAHTLVGCSKCSLMEGLSMLKKKL